MSSLFKKVLGGFLLIAGFFLILNSAGITGFVKWFSELSNKDFKSPKFI